MNKCAILSDVPYFTASNFGTFRVKASYIMSRAGQSIEY